MTMTSLPETSIQTVRCSSLPLATICAASVRPAEVQIDQVNEAADAGTAVHFALARLVTDGSPFFALSDATERFPSVDPDELRMLFWAGVRAWKEICDWMPNPRAEVALSHGGLTGHADVDSIKARRIDVVDWKSGHKDYLARDQGFGYAWLEFQDADRTGDAFPVDEVGVHFVWLRTGEIESYVVTRERADEWYSELVAKVLDWDGVYRPGDHCLHCRRNHECPAQTALVRRDVAMFSDGVATDLASMPGPDFVALQRKLKGLVVRAEEALKAMRAEVDRRGGDVDAGDGTHLFFAEENGPRVVDAMAAWPILQSRLTDAELSPAIKVSLSKVESAVAAKAGKGKGAKAKRDLAEELESAHAVRQTTIRKLRDERKK
jgi:hypothetical protein